MEALCRPIQHPFFFRHPAASKPFSFSSSSCPKPSLLSLRASPSSSQPIASPLPSLLRSASIAATAAAALFLARFRNPVLAAAYPPPPPAAEVQPQTLSDDIKSLRSLMEQKVKEQKLVEAIAVIDRMIALEPGKTDLQLLKAHLQSYNGEAEAAKKGFEQLLEKDPFLVEAYHGLVVAASDDDDDELDDILRRVEKAMELCRKANRKEQLRDFRLLMAQIMVIAGNYEDSLKIYRELVKEEPKDFRPYLCQGLVYTLLKMKDEAEKQFQKYRGLVPDGHPYAHYFDDKMIRLNVFGQSFENKSKASFKS